MGGIIIILMDDLENFNKTPATKEFQSCVMIIVMNVRKIKEYTQIHLSDDGHMTK